MLTNRVFSSRSNAFVLAAVYALYFATGATALVFEILWTRQFVIVFGNSTYAISVVLAAFMGGLGIGAWLFGRIADRRKDFLWLFALIEGGIIIWALLIPSFLGVLARAVPVITAPISSLAVESAVRFALSFAVLVVPCVLMGGTLPVLARFVVKSQDVVATRFSILYGINTLGAAAGCFATGFFFLETFGQAGTNMLAVWTNFAVLALVLTLRALAGDASREGRPAAIPLRPDAVENPAPAPEDFSQSSRRLLLVAAFVSGFATMAVEVLWVRYLVFVVPNSQYSFTGILGVLLSGLALGSLLYNVLLARRRRQLLFLAAIEIILGPVTLVALMAAGFAAMRGDALFSPTAGGFLDVKGGALGMAAMTVFLPAVLIGAVFPLVTAAYAQGVSSIGRSVGKVYAVNTFGSILGSVAPILFLVGWFGIQDAIFAVAVLNSCLGVLILLVAWKNRRRLLAAAAVAVTFAIAWLVTPANLTQTLFFANPKHKGLHQEVVFYREGPTATVMAVKDRLTGLNEVYIGGVEEVPTVYSGRLFFKLFGSLGPLLHPAPRDVLVLCLGGGVAAGTVIESPEVQSVECVDLVRDMVGASRALSDVNNNLVESPKFAVAIEDARNYLAKSRRKFPVILCDSTHPKSPDSWPLYTTEFYRAVKGALADDGIFIQWAPLHGMGVREYQIILGTFQSVFPHASLWYIAGYDETGSRWATTMMLATPEKLSIDLRLLQRRLSAEPVRKDLEYWSLDTPEGILGAFLCGEDALREWTAGAPVNTDDLPFTQYHTKFTGATEYGWPEIAPHLESVWPYLELPAGEDYSRLRAALEERLAARKILLERSIADALKALPGDPALLRMNDNLRRGEEYLQRLAETYRDDGRMLTNIAQKMQAACGYAGKDPVASFGPVADLYAQALALNPRNVSALVGLATLVANTGNSTEAQGYMKKALRIDPDSVDAHFSYGELLFEDGKFPEAIEHFERAARLAPDNVPVHNSLAIALTAVGSADMAIAHIEKTIALSGGSVPDYYYNLGCAYSAKGDAKNAAESFRRAISGNPASPQYHLLLGIALLDGGDVQNARAEFETVLSMDAADPAARTKLAVIALSEGRLDDCIGQLRDVLASSPADPEARENLAKALVQKRDFAQAERVLRDGIEMQPTVEMARQLVWLLATCPSADLRNGREAIDLAENLDRVTGYSSADVIDALAAAYAEAGRFPDAVKAAQQALSRATLQRKADLATQIQKRLDLYQAGRSYHDQ